MTITDIVLTLLILALISGALWKMRRDKKKGISCSSCGSCPSAGSCSLHKKKN